MADDTEEKHLDNPTNTQLENPSDEIMPTKDSETISVTQETENMEVHHHPDLHHKPKKWKEYLLEFLMIFLAVTLGFFAESLREHLTDKSKEKEYIISLRKDLISDTVNIHTWINSFNSRITEYDSLINMLRFPENVLDGAEMYWLARVTTRGTVFDDNNSTIVQLNSSGNFRLISSKATATKIVNYEKDIDDYKNVNTYDSYEARALYEPQSKIFDAFVFNDMSKPLYESDNNTGNSIVNGFRKVLVKPSGNPKLLSQDKDKINEFVYYLHQRRSTFVAEILILYKQEQDASELINLLSKQYNLEND